MPVRDNECLLLLEDEEWSTLDGRADAPSGANTFTNATLLSGYAVRPPWQVAGVDYPVGPNGTFVGTAVSAGAWTASFISYCNTQAAAAGGTSDSTHFPAMWFDNTNGLIIDGWNINGAAIYLHISCINSMIRNCKIVTAVTGGFSCVHVQATSGNQGVTVEYCDLSMPAGATGNACLSSGGSPSGSLVVRYNYIHDTDQQAVSVAGQFNIDYRFNYIFNVASRDTTGLVHPNYLINTGNNGNINIVRVEFNCTVQQPQLSAGEGFQFNYGDGVNPPQILSNPILRYNTMIATGSGSMSYMNHGVIDFISGVQVTTSITGTGICTDNYFDRTGAFGAFYTNSSCSPPESFSPTYGWTFSGNKNMVNGLTINPDNTEI